MTHITALNHEVASGNHAARDELYASAYGELSRLARARLRDGGRNTLMDTSALVHESYLRCRQAGVLRSDDRRGFFAYSSRVMRSVIIDCVRERRAQRRGGALLRQTLDTAAMAQLPAQDDHLLGVNDALDALAAVEPRLAQVVEMRYFGGCTECEVAQALDLTERTVRRDWVKARRLLGAMLQP